MVAPDISAPDVAATPMEIPSPLVSAGVQVVGDDGRIVIGRVVSDHDGWIVVYTDEDGQKGEVLGYSSVPEGENDDLIVTINPLHAGDALFVVLHTDDGEIGTFEFPGPDHPLENGSFTVEDHFRIVNQATIPEISVSDQEVNVDGVITIDLVAATKPGWLVIQLDDDGQPGEMVAYRPVFAGSNMSLTLSISWSDATPVLHAVLYEDSGDLDIFEVPSVDKIIQHNGVPVSAAFESTFPPDIFVLQQPIVNGEIVVERAVSYGPGWLAIYFDEEGQLGNIIGQASLEDGINEQIIVAVVESAATPNLHVMLHQDTGTIGEFEFPLADPMVIHRGLVPNPTTFRTDAGNYLITRDQPLSSEDEVVVPLVVVDLEAWIVFYNDNAGEIGDMIGLSWLPAGVHRDVTVNIDPDLATMTLHAVLHLDAGDQKEFEYPDGPDIRLRRNSKDIDSPFSLISDNESE
jgi:hypothetical protein